MKTKALTTSAIIAACFTCGIAHAQISIVDLNPIIDNFDEIGDPTPTNSNSTTATNLPTGWKISPSATANPDYFSGSNYTALNRNSDGGGVTTNARYNWGMTGGTDRAIGMMASTGGSFQSPASIMVGFTNNTGISLPGFSVSYDIEQYRQNVDPVTIDFYVSRDGSTWSQINAASVTFDGGTSTYYYGAPNAVSRSVNVSFSDLSLVDAADGQSFYLRWGVVGGANGQGIGLDNFSLSTVPEPSTYAALFGIVVLGFTAIRRRNRTR